MPAVDLIGRLTPVPGPTTDRYFLPPTHGEVSYRPEATAGMPASPRFRRLMLGFNRGDAGTGPSDAVNGTYTIGSTAYAGGRWTGPLTDAQVAEITAAGLAGRIVSIAVGASMRLLPAGLDA